MYSQVHSRTNSCKVVYKGKKQTADSHCRITILKNIPSTKSSFFFGSGNSRLYEKYYITTIKPDFSNILISSIHKQRYKVLKNVALNLHEKKCVTIFFCY